MEWPDRPVRSLGTMRDKPTNEAGGKLLLPASVWQDARIHRIAFARAEAEVPA